MKQQGRPALITFVCFINFLIIFITGLGFTNNSIRDALFKNYGWACIPYLAIGVIFSLVASLGYWFMRRWGFYAFLAIILISVGMYIFLFPKAMFVPYILPQILYLIIGLKYYRLLI
jgi:hypothetical protein